MRECRSPFLDFFLVFLRQLFDKRRDVDAPGRFHHPLWTDAGITQRDIGGDIAGEKKNILQNQSQMAPKRLFVPFADIDAVD